MLNVLFLTQIYSVFVFAATYQKTLTVSHKGFDFKQCGIDIPCHTILYTLSERASSNDVIKIDNQDLEIPHTYIINASSPLFENITLTGINGLPKIRGKNFIFDMHLFHDDVKRTHRNLTHITIRIENIWLTKTGIVRVNNAPSTLNVQIINSTVSELMKRNTASIIDSKAKRTIIMINKRPWRPYSSFVF